MKKHYFTQAKKYSIVNNQHGERTSPPNARPLACHACPWTTTASVPSSPTIISNCLTSTTTAGSSVCESGDQHKEQEGTLEQGADAQRGFLRDCEHDICQCLYGIPHPIPLTRLPCEELDMKGQHSARHSDQQHPVTKTCLPTWTHSTSPTSHSHGDILHGQKEKKSGHNAMHCFSQ